MRKLFNARPKRYRVSHERRNLEDIHSHPQGEWEVVYLASTPPHCRISTTIHIQNDVYFIQQEPDVQMIPPNTQIPADCEQSRTVLSKASTTISPITVLNCARSDVTPEYVLERIESFLSDDPDVTTPNLLKAVLLNGCEHTDDVHESIVVALKAYGCENVISQPDKIEILEGPHFFSNLGIFRAFRLSADHQEAFVLTTTAQQQNPEYFESLAASTGDSHTLAIPIPSRLHFTSTQDKPLAGLRIAVKDLFHMSGIHTGGGNRAYRSLYGVRSKSSLVVDLAIAKGCIVVGKTKTAEFGGSQEVCGDWADYSFPLNCRADGYLTATGSSTGSAAALAAYDFLDISIGTDAGGSVRDPAAAQGLFALRPSHDGSEEKDAIVPCPRFQRSGYFARDLKLLEKFVRYAVALPSTLKMIPSIRKVAFPSDYHAENPDVHEKCKSFVRSLANYLHTEPFEKPIAETWEQTRPKSIESSFDQYFKNTFMNLLAHDYWKHASRFREDYRETFSREPYVSRVTQWLWKFGSSRTQAQLAEANEQVEVHNEWFNKHVLQASTDETTIVVTPKYNMNRRDEYWRGPEDREFLGFDQNLHASFAGLVDLIVPIGQIPFMSPVSGTMEQLPVSVSIVTSRGLDIPLLELVIKFLKDDNRPTSVYAGRTAFQV